MTTKNGKRKVKKLSAFALSCSMALGLVQMPDIGKGQNVKTSDAIVKAYAAGDDTNDDWLHVEGSDIKDKDGNVVRLTGANWFGFNCCECLLHGLGWGADLHETIAQCANRGINLLRIPISTELLLAWKNGEQIGNETHFVKNGVNGQYNDNPDLVKEDGTSMTNLEVFDQLMKYCKDYGIKVMVDVHSAAANNAGHNFNLWYGMTSSSTGQVFTTQDWIDGWVWLVDRYKNDDTLIACDLKNEPHGKPDEGDSAAIWDDSTKENNWKYAAERCGNAILDVNPNLLIMIEGVECNPKEGYTYDDQPQTVIGKYQVYTNFDGAWWGGNLRMAKKYPVDFGDAQRNQQIVYSPHDYGPLVWKQDWFDKDFSEQTLLDDYWYDAWAYLVEENISPLLIGEWGGFMDGKDNEKWMNLIADYMNKKNISHTFWCVNPNSGDTGGLLKDDWKTWDESKYALFEKTLWKDAAGRYVGLDHQKGLGENGITIGEFYGSSSSPVTTQKQPDVTSGAVSTTQKENTTETVSTTQETPVATTQEDTEKESTTETVSTTQETPVATTQADTEKESTTETVSTTQRVPVVTTQEDTEEESTTETVSTTQRVPVATTQEDTEKESTTETVSTTQRVPVVTTQEDTEKESTTETVSTTQRVPVVTTQEDATTQEEEPGTTAGVPERPTQADATTQEREEPGTTAGVPERPTQADATTQEREEPGTTAGVPERPTQADATTQEREEPGTTAGVPERPTQADATTQEREEPGTTAGVPEQPTQADATTEDNSQKKLVEKISIKEELVLYVGEKERLEVTYYPEDAEDKTVTWYSLDTDKVLVSKSGDVSGIAKTQEDVYIYAKTQNGIIAYCKVTVLDKKEQPADATTQEREEPGTTAGVPEHPTQADATTQSNAVSNTQNDAQSSNTTQNSNNATTQANASVNVNVNVNGNTNTIYANNEEVTASISIVKVTNLKKGKVKKNSVTLKWKKQKDATGYKIYRYNNVKKKYVLCKVVKGNTATMKNLKKNTKYKFRVAAYKKGDGMTIDAPLSKALIVKTAKK